MKAQQTTTQIVSQKLDDGTMVELIHDGKKTKLAVYKEGVISMRDDIEVGGELLVPISASNNLIKHGAILLPGPPAAYESESQLIDEIRSYLYRYVDLSPEFVDTAIAYVLLTWVYDAFNELCYLRFSGDYGSGKSRALFVIGSICNRPFFASAASTISPVFYTLDLFRGTLILDEADFRYSDLQSDITKIMNNGSVKGFPVLRQTKTAIKEFDPRAFDVYGPKIVAMRKKFDDIALESRFVTEEMGARTLREDMPLHLPFTQAGEAAELRKKLLMYRFVTLSRAGIDESLVDRARGGRWNQTIIPLLSVINDEGMRAAVKSCSIKNEEQQKNLRLLSVEAELIETIWSLLEGAPGDAVVQVGMIASALRQKLAGDAERPITNRYVGQLLRADFGLFTFKKHGTYVLPASEYEKVKQIAKRYGVIE